MAYDWMFEPDPISHLATPAEALREYAANVCELDSSECPCRGLGWIGTNYDTHERCPAHYHGQEHPEAYCERMDEEREDTKGERR